MLSDYESSLESSNTSKVLKIRGKIAVVQTLGEKSRQVPVSHIFKLKGFINPLLREPNYSELNKMMPLRRPTI